MKKYIIIATFLLLGTYASAQDVTFKAPAFSYGPSIGIGHSYMAPYISRGADPVGSVGIIAIYAPWEHWGIGGDVRYSMEGSRTRTESGPRETDLDYLRIPIRAIYFFRTVNDIFRPKISAGPSFGFLTRQSDTFGAKANSFDMGFNSTVGFNLRLSDTGIWLNMDAVYYQGLLDVMKDNGTTEWNGNIDLNIGLAFGI